MNNFKMIKLDQDSSDEDIEAFDLNELLLQTWTNQHAAILLASTWFAHDR